MMERQKINKSIYLIGFVVLLLGAFSQGCYYDVEDILYPPSAPCDTSVTTYNAIILPIIENNCFVCHDAATGLGDVVLEPHSELEFYALNGTLFCSIDHDPGCSEMPKNANKLSDCDIRKIKRWVDNGALEN